MSTITKKQTALALVAVVFATAMVASIAASADQMAFARHHHHSHHHGGDGGNSITVASSQRQSANCQTAGGNSPIDTSCINVQTSENNNDGGIISN
jgi:hypothetical protein